MRVCVCVCVCERERERESHLFLAGTAKEADARGRSYNCHSGGISEQQS